jgi:hypothetical protein
MDAPMYFSIRSNSHQIGTPTVFSALGVCHNLAAIAPYSAYPNAKRDRRIQSQQVCLRLISTFCIPAQDINLSPSGIRFNAKDWIQTMISLSLLPSR